FELAAYEAEAGQVLTGSLMDYALPRADDIPAFEGALTADYPSRANRLGVKGSGQAGAIASPATVMNAVMNALAPLGVTHLDMPATPAKVWEAIRTALDLGVSAGGSAQTNGLAAARSSARQLPPLRQQ